MTELGVLFCVVVGVYLFQCICWAPSGATVFRLGISKGGSRATRGFAWNALHTAGFWSNPLPLAPLLVVNWPTISLSAEGLQLAEALPNAAGLHTREDLQNSAGQQPADAPPNAPVSQTNALQTNAQHAPDSQRNVPQAENDSALLPWDHLTLTRHGSRLLANGHTVLHASPAQIGDLQNFLQRVAGAKASSRAPMIEQWLRKATDFAAARDRLELFRKKSRQLKLLAVLEFCFLFLILPWIFSRAGSRAIWYGLFVLLAASAAITVEFWILHKAFYPAAREGRFTAALTILLSPIAAIRALDTAARDLLSGFHPVTVAAVVCAPPEFAAFAGRELRHLSFGHAGDPWFLGKLRECLQRVLQQRGLTADQLLAPPQRQEGCACYCPRCLAQYQSTRAACTDCGYEGLLPLPRYPKV